MALGAAIRDILIADAAVLALVSNRIYPNQVKQNEAYPHLVYNLVGNTPTDTKDSGRFFDNTRVQVDCYAIDYGDCEDLADKVRTALDRYTGTVSSTKIVNSIYQGTVDMNEFAASVDASLGDVFHRAVDVIFYIGES